LPTKLKDKLGMDAWQFERIEEKGNDLFAIFLVISD
jgi:hypothetical protein